MALFFHPSRTIQVKVLLPRVCAFVTVVALAGCATAVRDDFKALVAEESFPGLEDKIATLAARLARGEERDQDGALARSLWGLALGELFLFQRYLALSSRVVELEAAHAELEGARLDLLLRRLGLGPTTDAASGDALVAEPTPSLFACPRYRVARIEFITCR